MIIVITPEKPVEQEPQLINRLFQEGLDLLHIRKPFMEREKTSDFIQKIDKKFHHQLVLHNHFDLSDDFNITRFHFREAERQNNRYKTFKYKTISTSVHDIEVFNVLDSLWEYAFVSPVFPSISKKGYGENSSVLHDLKNRRNSDVKLIFLGGINEQNVSEVSERNVDGVALLGAIWENDDPLSVFRACMKKFFSRQFDKN